MRSNIEEIGKKALELSTHDRALLIRQLIESMEEGEEEEEVDAEGIWTKESRARYDSYKQGKTSENLSDQVFRNTRNKLK